MVLVLILAFPSKLLEIRLRQVIFHPFLFNLDAELSLSPSTSYSQLFSLRNRVLVVTDWAKTKVLGR